MESQGVDKSKTFLNDRVWSEVLGRFMKMKRVQQNVTLQDLSLLLEEQFNIKQSEANLRNKFHRGNYSAQLLLMSLVAMGVEDIDLTEVRKIYDIVKTELET